MSLHKMIGVIGEYAKAEMNSQTNEQEAKNFLKYLEEYDEDCLFCDPIILDYVRRELSKFS